MPNLNEYKKIVGSEQINQIYTAASKLKGKRILHINSTYQGGGVSEILNSLVSLMNDAGIETDWRILHASPDFFRTTKKFHNALQGKEINFTKMKQKIYLDTLKKFSKYTHFDHSLIIVHDIQPSALINFYKKNQPWVWRCHLDLSQPNKEVFDYFKQFILKYDLMVVLSKKFIQDLPIQQEVMHPSIDPLSIKNKEISEKIIEKYLSKYGINTDRPLISQVSRFDLFKDHLGVIKIFKQVKRKVKCRLVLIGSIAMDDPEAPNIYKKILKKTERDKDIIVLNEQNDILVNAIQRASSVVIQKSIKEGFGLTVSEALWKGTPVVASNVGGISEQIIDGRSGYLLNPDDKNGFSDKIIGLLKDEKLREEMGKFGKQYVKENFLITTHLLNWINLLDNALSKKREK